MSELNTSGRVPPARGGTRVAPLKPWETPGSASARPSTLTSSLNSTSTASSLASTAGPRPPARPWERGSGSDLYGRGSYGGSSFGDRYGSSYGSGYGSGYGSSYGGSSYGSSYDRLGSSYGGYGSSYGGSYGSGYGSGYGSSYGSGYGSGYESSYGGGYGSSYGGGFGGSYGGGFGGGYGLNNGPYGPGPMDKQGPGGHWLSNGFSWMHSVQYVVETFSRFSHLLGMNYDAMYGSFTSVIMLIERVTMLNSEVMTLIKTFTLFGLLQSVVSRFMGVFRYLTGRPQTPSNAIVHTSRSLDIKEFQEFTKGSPQGAAAPNRPSTGSIVLVLLFTFIGIPYLVSKLFKPSGPNMEKEWNKDSGPEQVRAKYDFEPETSRDLGFRQGDIIHVLGKPHPDWWDAELNGRTGTIPSNYVESLSEELELQS